MEKEFDRNARPDHIPVKNAFAISIGAQIENGHHSTLRAGLGPFHSVSISRESSAPRDRFNMRRRARARKPARRELSSRSRT